MGRSMCGHLIKAGYPTTLYSRTKSKCEDLLTSSGTASWALSPRAVAERSDIVFTIVGYPHEAKQVILDEETGVLAGMKSGSTLIDCTTSSPELAVTIFEAGKAKGIHALDAPVSGGDIGARNATLSIMCGGTEGTFQTTLPVLQVLGKNINHMGGPGCGQATKATNQVLIASGMIALCEGLMFASASGLDLEKTIEAVASGAAGSWSLSNYGPRILKGDFKPGFFVDHYIKDLDIVLSECRRMDLKLPGMELATNLYKQLRDEQEKGGEMGTQALIKVFERMNGRAL